MSDAPAMRMLTHDDRDNIPEGFAMLYLDNNGWVGTNNGYPHHGQPALYPEEQAIAIKNAWWHHFILGTKASQSASSVQPEKS